MGTHLSSRRKMPKEDEVCSPEEEQLSILALPLEIRSRIIEGTDFLTRTAVRESCRGLYSGEAKAKLQVEELALYRNFRYVFTLAVKDRLSETWRFTENACGMNVLSWKRHDEQFFQKLINDARLVPFSEKETPLGDLAVTLQEYLNGSTIEKLTIDGFHCSDASMAQLCELLRHKKIEDISIAAPFSTTSDACLFKLVQGCPNLRSFTLCAHRCPAKDVLFEKDNIFEKDFLLFAASRLDKLLFHSGDLDGYYDEDHSVVDDDLLLRLLSDKCSHLELLFHLPLLTAEGIVRAIQQLCKRNEPAALFEGWFRSEHLDSLWSMMGVYYPPGEEDAVIEIVENCNPLLTVTVVDREMEYCKITMTKEIWGTPNITSV